MSDHFAEATVNISPSLTGFVGKLDEDLKEAMKKVKPPTIRVKAGLEKGFLGNLRTQVNDAITRVQGQIKPIRVRVLIEAPSRRALSEIVKGAPVTLPGAIAPGGARSAGVVAQADNERLLNSLRAQGAHDFGLLAAAEDKATKVRERNTGASKKLVTEEQKVARSGQLIADIRKRTSLIDVNAATKTGDLAKAQAALAEATKLAGLADEARVLHVTKETVALQAATRAEQQLRLERLQSIEAAIAAGKGGGAQAGLGRGVQNARAAGAANLRASVTALNEADAAFAKAGTSAKDLAAQEAILVKRSEALKVAKANATAATKAESDTLRVATANTLKKAEADKLASQAAVQNIKDQIGLQQKQAAASAAASRQSARAAATQASSEKRRSEQLSRGSQASILSLAGIRGATLAASRSFLVGAAAITVFAKAVKQFADLERNLDVFRATTSATANQMEQVRKEATALGADLTLPSVAAGDAAGAMVELAKAGLSVQDSIDGARGVLELATAAAIDTADAVRLVANVLNAFSLSGRDAITVADTLANAANAAQGSIADIGTAFQQAASAGHQVGLSFQDTATFLTILAKNGLRGSDAGTSLRTALIRLVNPSKKAQEAFDKLGIVLRDAAGNLRPDVFLQIANATAALAPAQRDATIALIGGQDAFRAVTILGRQSVGAFLAMRAALRQTGTAAELAKARTEGLHGAMDGLQSVLETIGTTTAGHVGPALAKFVHTVSTGLTAFSQNQQVADTLNQTLRATAQGFNLLGEAIKGVAAVALPLVGVLASIGTSIGVSTILSAVVAFKAFTKVAESAAIANLPLKLSLAKGAMLEFGTALSGIVAQRVALRRATQAAAEPAVTGFARLTQVETQLGLAASASALKTASLGAVLGRLGPAALSAATSTLGIAVAVAAVTAGIVFLVTRASDMERALARSEEATVKLADALDRLKSSTQDVANIQRSVQTLADGITQSTLDQLRAQRDLALSESPRGSTERRQLLLNLRVTTQDLKFATDDYRRALKDLKEQEEKQAATEDDLNEALADKARTLIKLRDEAFKKGREASIQLGLAGFDNEAFSAQTQGIQELEKELDKLARKDRKSSDDSVAAIGRRESALLGFIKASEKQGREIKPFIFTAVVKDQPVQDFLKSIVKDMTFASEAARQAFIKNIINLSGLSEGLKTRLLNELIPPTQNAVLGVKDWLDHKGRPILDEAGRGLAEALGSGFSLSAKLLEAEAAGATNAVLLSIAKAQAAQAHAKFDRLRKVPPSRRTPAQQTAVTDQAQVVLDADAEVERIQGDITSKVQDTAQKIKDAQQDLDAAQQKIVDAALSGRKATLLQRKITSAALTDWLGDDLKTTQAWLNYLRGLAKTLPARLKAAGASKAIITAFAKAISDTIFDVTKSIEQLNKDIEDNAKKRHEAAQAILMERFDLRISIAQSREDVAAELKARRQKLAAITKELHRVAKEFGKNSIQWLRVKDEQQKEIAAINDLKKTNDDRNRAFQELSFSFLTTQQGFAANLLSNLLPIGAIGGTVAANQAARGGGGGGGGAGGNFGQPGGPQPGGGVIPGMPTVPPGRGRSPGADAAATAAAKEAGAPAGPTRGQQSVELDLLRQILVAIRHLSQATKHPENKAAHRRSNAALETHH